MLKSQLGDLEYVSVIIMLEVESQEGLLAQDHAK